MYVFTFYDIFNMGQTALAWMDIAVQIIYVNHYRFREWCKGVISETL